MEKVISPGKVDAPELYGLILTGGKSSRMGFDKNLIAYHKKPHSIWTFQLLQRYTTRCFISISKNQDEPETEFIRDEFSDLGPIAAIYSAFKAYHNEAFFVIANDLPFISDEILQCLIEARDPGFQATAFRNPKRAHPEPLACIWEPASFPIIDDFIQKKNYSLLDVLKSLHVKEVILEPAKLFNANTKEDSLVAKAKIKDG